jgi:DNA-directed RNA polymerase I, II, and III subunit RPABC2
LSGTNNIPRSPGYDGGEDNYYEDPEPEEYDPEAEPLQTEDTEVRNDDEGNIVASGDLQAAAASTGGKGKKEPKIKKIPDNERKTTPYMTKYEKARILGTRALQIRFVGTGETVGEAM